MHIEMGCWSHRHGQCRVKEQSGWAEYISPSEGVSSPWDVSPPCLQVCVWCYDITHYITQYITLFIRTLPILSSLFCHYSEAKTVKTKPRHDPSQIFAISVGLSCSRSQKDETRANKCFTFESCEGNVRRRWGMQMVVRGQRRATWGRDITLVRQNFTEHWKLVSDCWSSNVRYIILIIDFDPNIFRWT